MILNAVYQVMSPKLKTIKPQLFQGKQIGSLKLMMFKDLTTRIKSLTSIPTIKSHWMQCLIVVILTYPSTMTNIPINVRVLTLDTLCKSGSDQ